MAYEVCFMLFASLVFVQGSIWSSFQDKEDLKQLMKILSKPRAPTGYNKEENEVARDTDDFSWKSCGSASDLASIKSLSVGPDPLLLPGNFTLAVDATLSKTVDKPIKLDLSIKKKMFVWVEIPCVDDIGSCTYDDVCSLATSFDCPAAFIKYGIPCRCPVQAGHYSLPPSTITIPPIPLPSFLKDGDYKIEAKVSTQDQQIACLELTLAIQAGKVY